MLDHEKQGLMTQKGELVTEISWSQGDRYQKSEPVPGTSCSCQMPAVTLTLRIAWEVQEHPPPPHTHGKEVASRHRVELSGVILVNAQQGVGFPCPCRSSGVGGGPFKTRLWGSNTLHYMRLELIQGFYVPNLHPYCSTVSSTSSMFPVHRHY